MTTVWENKTTYIHAELSGLVDRTGDATRTMLNSGFSMDGVRQMLDRFTQGQSVMLATNEILWTVALVFAVAAGVIWLAPKPKRSVAMGVGGH